VIKKFALAKNCKKIIVKKQRSSELRRGEVFGEKLVV
jgi:hypothetical protein